MAISFISRPARSLAVLAAVAGLTIAVPAGAKDRFTTSGRFVTRIVSHRSPTAPFDLAIVPGDFGDPTGSLLIANLGPRGAPRP